jgi:hypothetical protein
MASENNAPTWAEASRCPKCATAGKVIHVNSRRDGSKLNTLLCENERCMWYSTTWIVQVRADGSIPTPEVRPRSRIVLPDQSTIDAIQLNAQRTHDASLKPGTEIGR